MIKKRLTYAFDERQRAVEELKKLLPQCSVMTFTGDLGTGKTTLIRALLRACGVEHTITSPTFTYVNIYENKRGERFYHFDLYRIKTIDEFQQMGFDEYLHQPDSWAFIEWPEVIMPLLDNGVCQVTLDYHREQNKRIMQVKCAKKGSF